MGTPDNAKEHARFENRKKKKKKFMQGQQNELLISIEHSEIQQLNLAVYL